MESTIPPRADDDADRQITDTIRRERTRLGHFIRRRVPDPSDAEDILQDVLHEFVQACRLPAPIEQASAWLFRVARHRIIDRFRKRREVPITEDDEDLRLDLALPSGEAGPEEAYARSLLLNELAQALDELPAAQRDVFIAHELDGVSFKEMAERSGVGVNTLLSRKRYAVLHLRERLQAAYDELEL